MDLQSILSQYASKLPAIAPNADDHFDAAAKHLPTEVVGQGVSEAFRSDQTPAFGQMVGDLFGQSNPQQQAGALNELLATLGPAAATGGLGALLSRVMGNAPSSGGSPAITPEQASQLTRDQVNQIASHAEKQDPGVVERLGNYYAQHPQLVKTLGSAALAIALATIANRTKA